MTVDSGGNAPPPLVVERVKTDSGPAAPAGEVAVDEPVVAKGADAEKAVEGKESGVEAAEKTKTSAVSGSTYAAFFR